MSYVRIGLTWVMHPWWRLSSLAQSGALYEFSDWINEYLSLLWMLLFLFCLLWDLFSLIVKPTPNTRARNHIKMMWITLTSQTVTFDTNSPTLCCGLNVCVLPNSYVETLIPSMMILGAGALGRWLGLEGGALRMGLLYYKRNEKAGSLSLP